MRAIELKFCEQFDLFMPHSWVLINDGVYNFIEILHKSMSAFIMIWELFRVALPESTNLKHELLSQ